MPELAPPARLLSLMNLYTLPMHHCSSVAPMPDARAGLSLRGA